MVEFENVWGPTLDELRAWASETDPGLPEQDWELAISVSLNAREIIDLFSEDGTSDAARLVLLDALYVHVGDAVRCKRSDELQVLNGVLSQNAFPAPLQHWAERARILLANPATYSYDYWGLPPTKFLDEGGL